MKRLSRLVVLLLAGIVLASIVMVTAACGGGSDDELPEAAAEPQATATPEPLPEPTFTAVPEPDPTATPAPSATAEPTVVPDSSPVDPAFQETPGLRAMSRIVSWINGDLPLAEEYETVFTEEMIEALPYDDFGLIRLQLQSGAPHTLSEPENAGVQSTAILRDRDGANPLKVTITMMSGLVAGIFFEPVADDDAPTTLVAAVEQLNNDAELSYLIADVTDPSQTTGTNPSWCATPLQSQNPDRVVPLGSIFKLYVLGAAVDAVNAGTLTWDADVTIRDELDSHPSGFTQEEVPGSTLTVRQLAVRMISISDNTATDHLLDLLGRDVVEQSLAAWGHSNPEATFPFMSTGELFRLKSSSFSDQLDQYVTADTTTRREILTAVAAEPLPDVSEFSPAPLAIKSAEWFATPADVCRVMTFLADDSEARRILAVPSALNDGDPSWDYVGSKGGSEPGVLAVASLVEPGDGRTLVVITSITNETTGFGFSTTDLVIRFRDLALADIG